MNIAVVSSESVSTLYVTDAANDAVSIQHALLFNTVICNTSCPAPSDAKAIDYTFAQTYNAAAFFAPAHTPDTNTDTEKNEKMIFA
jgi:hypothetical protein